MNHNLFIKLLSLLLILIAVSPICRALSTGDAVPSVPVSALIPGISAASYEHSPAPAESYHPIPNEHLCWFHAAHVFQSTPAQPVTIPLPLLATVFFTTLLLISVWRQALLLQSIKPPDRDPPSQPYLQIFRI